MLVSPNPERIRLAYELGITKVILPEFDEMMNTEQETPHHMYTVGEHTIKALTIIRADKILRLMLLHDVGKPMMKTVDRDGVAHFKYHDVEGEKIVRNILKRLKFDNDTLRKVAKLVKYHDYRMPARTKNVRRAVNLIGEDLFPFYLEVRMADTLAQSEYQRTEKLANLDGIRDCFEEIQEKGQCVSLKTLAVTGNDLIQLGMKPGKEIGEMLNTLLQLVLDNPEYNNVSSHSQ